MDTSTCKPARRKRAPAKVSDLWLPDARWLMPTPQDRALARAVVERADRERLESALRAQAELARHESAKLDACLASERAPRQWPITALSIALILAPVAWLVHTMT